MKLPPFLKQGDSVAVVATAKRLEVSIEQGIERLESWGLNVVLGKSLHERNGYFAGTDEERREDIQTALDNPEIRAIIFARGGYGTTRIIDSIDFSSFIHSPKWLVGFSDLTSITLQASVLEVPAIHGPVCMTLGQDKLSDESLRDLLFGKLDFGFPLLTNLSISGVTTGRITGGNLSMIYESIGASNEIETDGNILFLEEVGEAKYSVDRMMNKLKRCGKLEGLSGVIIGNFSSITDTQKYFSESVEEILMSYLKPLNIPVAVGLEAGHEQRNLPLVIGLDVEMEVSTNKLKLKYFQ